MPTASRVPQVYQLNVTLDGIAPAIWRRLLVPSSINLEKLHEVLQVAFGWTNSHLHQFIVGETYYGIPNDEIESDSETKDERDYTLAQIARKKGAKAVYQYDFGDCWEHLIVVEDVRPIKGKLIPPSCLDGARACPPEDVGSTSGYEDFLKAIKNPKHPEHKNMIEWIGGSFDPEAFDVQKTNDDLGYWLEHGLPSADEDELL